MTIFMDKKNYLVVGLGITGLSCVRFLRELGHSVMVTDSRVEPPKLNDLLAVYPETPLSLGHFDANLFRKADVIVVSPGVDIRAPAFRSLCPPDKPIIGDIELFSRSVKVPVVGITGSNGKSTVTTLLGEMAKRSGVRVAVGGNLGPAALDLLSSSAATGSVDLYILELSSFQLDLVDSLPLVAATILNVTEDHRDRYSSFADYVEAKQRIYRQARFVIVNRDDGYTHTRHSVALSFGRSSPVGDSQLGLRGHALYLGDEYLMSRDEIKLQGDHNVQNALCAIALGCVSGLSREAMCQELRSFPGLPHRTQLISEVRGVRWYNDSKGTNVGASIAAIEGIVNTVSGRLIWIAGGLGKGADFTVLQPIVAKNIDKCYLFGKDKQVIFAAIGSKVPCVQVQSLEDAVLGIAGDVQAGDVVLFSPACASFDGFKDFAHRGDKFSEFVKNHWDCRVGCHANGG